jgi:hypothetical protein
MIKRAADLEEDLNSRFTLLVLSSATSSRQFSMGTAVADMNFIFTQVLSSLSTRKVFHQASYLSHRSRHATEEAVQTTPWSPPTMGYSCLMLQTGPNRLGLRTTRTRSTILEKTTPSISRRKSLKSTNTPPRAYRE